MEKSPKKFDDCDTSVTNETLEKYKLEMQSELVAPLKELCNFDTVKFKESSPEQKIIQNKTPEKPASSESDHRADLVDNDDGMLSTIEQARLLLAANKTPSKRVNRTPVKQNNSNGKKSVESSPITPGKQRRVELITLSSPKTKRLKQN